MRRKHGIIIADPSMLWIGAVLLPIGTILSWTPLGGGLFLATLGAFYLLGSMAPYRTRHRVGDPVAFFGGLLVIAAAPFYLPSIGQGGFIGVVILLGAMLAFAGFFLGREKAIPEVTAWAIFTPEPVDEKASKTALARRSAFGRRWVQRPYPREHPGDWTSEQETDD